MLNVWKWNFMWFNMQWCQFYWLTLYIHTEPVLSQDTQLLAQGHRGGGCKKEEIYFLFNLETLNHTTRKRIKSESRRSKKKSSPIFIFTFLFRLPCCQTKRERYVSSGLLKPSVLLVLPHHSLPASGGVFVQVGLSMYIPAPGCHAGDYVEEGRNGGLRLYVPVCLLPLKGGLGEAGTQRGWLWAAALV